MSETIPTFSVGTTVSKGVGGTLSQIDSKGRIILVSQMGWGGISVKRLDQFGVLDKTFGKDGVFEKRFPSLSQDDPSSVLVTSDDSIIIVGNGYHSSSTTNRYRLEVVKLTSTGSLDSTFGTSGLVSLETNNYSGNSVSGAALDSSGRILIAATHRSSLSGDENIAVIRLKSNGAMDQVSSFNMSSSGEEPVAIQYAPDGSALLLGKYYGGNPQTYVIKVSASGQKLSTFGITGKASVNFNAVDLEHIDNGSFAVVGTGKNGTLNQIQVAKYSSNGILDSSFGTNGFTYINIPSHAQATDIEASGGKIFVAGSTSAGGNGTDSVVIGLNADGSIDSSFGKNGFVYLDIGGTSIKLNPLADGTILVSGSEGVAKLSASGQFDPSMAGSTPANTLDATTWFIEGGEPVKLDGDVSIFLSGSDLMRSFNGYSLTLSRHFAPNSDDVFTGHGIKPDVTDEILIVEGIVVGKYSQSSGTLSINFNESATQSLVNNILRNLSYSNVSDAPPLSVQIDWSFIQVGDATGATGSTITKIYNVNDPLTGELFVEGQFLQGQLLSVDSKITDPDGDGPLTYEWFASGIKVGEGNSLYLSEPTVNKEISVRATHIDAAGNLEQLNFNTGILVENVNDIPNINDNSWDLEENPTTGLTLGNLNASDPDGDPLSYSIVSGNTDVDGDSLVAFAIDPSTGAITVNDAGDLNYESKRVFDLTVQASDGELSSTAIATVNLVNVNEAPVLTTSPGLINENTEEGQPALTGVIGNDAEGDAILYSIVSGNTDVDGDSLVAFAIDPSTGAITVNDAGDLNYESKRVFDLTVQASDGELSSTAIATVNLVNVNEAPVLTTSPGLINENTEEGQPALTGVIGNDAEGDAILYSIVSGNTDVDGDSLVAFAIDPSTGAITVNDAGDLNYESKRVFDLTVQASDGELSSTAIATVNLVNVNEAPTGYVSISGTAVEGQVLKVVSTLKDPDGAGTAKVQWLRDGSSISGATSSSYTLTSSDTGKSISARLSYTDGGGFAESRTSAAVVPAGLNPGVTITGSDRVTGEDGNTAVFSVKLDKAPVDPVTIKFAVSDTTEAKLSTSSLTFTSSNWNKSQTLTVTGLDDYDNDGNVSYNLTATVSTDDLSYKRVTVSSIGLTNNNDTLDAPIIKYGTDGIDYMRGNNGADRLYGKGHMDDIRGGRGNDRIYGQEDDDVLYGDDGNDWLYGGYDDDRLYGGNGDDELYGEAGADRLEGGAGNDYLDGGTGADTMIGGAGNDTYFVDNAKDVIDDRGLSTDEDTVIVMTTISYKLAANVESAELNDASGAASLTGNTLGNDLTGNDSNNTLDGGAGNDTLLGGDGSDILIGGTGTDILNGGTGDDYLYAGSGNDVVDAGSGNDIIIGGDGAGNDKYIGGTGIDTIKYTSAKSGITVDLSAKSNQAKSTLSGDKAGIGVDQLSGIENIIAGNYNDVLFGDSGNNKIEALKGNDKLNGGKGSDVMLGGAGNDTYYVDNTKDKVYETTSTSSTKNAGGTDLVYSSVSFNLNAYTGVKFVEKLTLTGSANTSATGNSLANTLTGNSGSNTLNGHTGSDTLIGGLGSDKLYGGVDRVRDVFDFNSIAESKVGTARDKVYNFVKGIDDIDLKTIDANTKVSGDQAFKFAGTKVGANSIWYAAKEVDGSKSTKDIIVYGDVNGDAKADFEIGLVGVTSITASDIVL